ncbi:MAG: dockerin type I domain-containing protein [Candidatus Zixiibacteriota bacterium]
MLAGPAEFDFNLLMGSPCIDAGHPGAIYNDPDGSRNDIGAIPLVPPPYLCGDVDRSDIINVLDVTFLVRYLYKGGPAPIPIASGDADGSGAVNLLDVTYLIRFLYDGGGAPICESGLSRERIKFEPKRPEDCTTPSVF